MFYLYEYFEVPVALGQVARFKRNRLTRRVFVFQANCAPRNNAWHEPGYGWGVWRPLDAVRGHCTTYYERELTRSPGKRRCVSA